MRNLLIASLVSILVACTTDGTTPGTDSGATDAGHADGGDAARVDAALPDSGNTCDVDGDGHLATTCGGDDCDDTDPHRFPQNVEVCDAAGHDEDCEPTTFGTTDADADGYVAAMCCNTDIAGAMHCGRDCDDTRVGVHPDAPEVCDGIDDDCDSAVDEMVLVTYYADCDGDGFGGGAALMLCTPSSCMGNAAVTDHLDCDDANRDVHPGVAEICDGTDNDCNGTADDEPAADAACAGTVANATSIACTSGACAATACSGGYHVCGGACAASAAVGTCGTSCTPCVAPAHASATCDGTSCGFACDAGWAVAGTGCDLAPPRPIAPLSTATVTSRRPTLRWSLAAGADGARVELCHDRACSSVIETIDVAGSSARPTADLPIGVVFWRLYGRMGTSTGTPVGPTWQMIVGARTAAIDTSWGTTLDVNGDGYADLAIGARGAPGGGRAYVYLGSAGGLAAAPATMLINPDVATSYFGTSVASAGDLNGDGYADVVVGASGRNSTSTGSAYVYLGSAGGLATSPATTLVGPDGLFAYFGRSVASAGDLNGDGYADIAIGAFGAASAGRVYLYRGSAAGLATTPTTMLTGPDPGGSFGISVASAGDVNGDTFPDLVVGAYGVSAQTGSTYVYLGSATGLTTTPATTLTGPDGSGGEFGDSVACADDVNGDGYADVAIGANGVSSGTGAAYVYLGGALGLASTPATTLVGPDGASGDFGISVASTGDVNRDGYADLAVGADLAGHAFVYLGSATGLTTSPTTSLTGPAGPDFGSSVAGTGDVNGDGYADLAIGDPAFPGSTGSTYLYYGSAAGVPTTPTTTLTGPDGGGGLFGGSVASAGDANSDRADVAVAAKPA